MQDLLGLLSKIAKQDLLAASYKHCEAGSEKQFDRS